MHDDLIDRIYEAAFVPEKWLGVIEDLSRVSGSATGGVVIFRSEQAVSGATQVFRLADVAGVLALERFGDAMGRLIADHPLHPVRRVERWFALRLSGYQGFVQSSDVLSQEELERDPPQQALAAVGLEAEACLVTPTSGGEAVLQAFQRRAGDGRFDEDATAALNAYAPHLSRASLLSARLSLERAISTVTALQAISLPAAVMRGSGAVLATNALFDAMQAIFLPAAHGRMAIADASADALFQEAIVQNRHDLSVRSIPVPANEGRQSLVVHLLPLRRAAHEIFSGADILIAVTAVSASAMVPSPTILTGLFDLTPAEARLAIALASGRSLKAAAADNDVTFSTARTYLDRIFRKTGANRQSQLVALLKSVQPFKP